MEKAVLGIDIAKKNFDVVLWQAGKQVHHSFANREGGLSNSRIGCKSRGLNTYMPVWKPRGDMEKH